ncbi:hypothetical protein JDV02_001358 [Purpureocillium takamizusanense]|uniref:Uncharacterized protein n=1 Tax=Purpureocillium takamizusanense TaxID=2060973 RepID=A0A9Q8Q7Z6_9HYPO|nr:uncharacterized protein JDV02_001358 [Purpureocillium takamizusanense]UNI14760.1 hypothetical protein JDV02_001358 [Purpureocillium takamizusanense]
MVPVPVPVPEPEPDEGGRQHRQPASRCWETWPIVRQLRRIAEKGKPEERHANGHYFACRRCGNNDRACYCAYFTGMPEGGGRLRLAVQRLEELERLRFTACGSLADRKAGGGGGVEVAYVDDTRQCDRYCEKGKGENVYCSDDEATLVDA